MRYKKKLFENPQSRLKRVMYGKEPTVYSFAIITPENPMGEKLTKAKNHEKHEELKGWLNSGNFKYIFIKGKYGNLENPFVILNINIEEVFKFGYKYNQESFIYAENDEESGKVIFEYWEKPKEGKYDLKDLEDHIKTVDDAKDFYTQRKSWKFNIPFSIFEEIDKKIYELYGHLTKKQIVEINEVNKHIALSENLCLKHYYLRRGHINYIIKKKYNKEWHKIKKEHLEKIRLREKKRKNWIEKSGYK